MNRNLSLLAVFLLSGVSAFGQNSHTASILPKYGYIRELSLIPPFGNGGKDAIRLELPVNQSVKHEIFDLGGNKLVEVITDLGAGNHSFEFTGEDLDGRRLPRGYYVYKVSSNDSTIAVKKIILR